jgi:cobalt/nickel transport system permease protein
VGAGHGGGSAGFHTHAHTPVHHLPPEVKVAATVGFVIAVVATPREAFWAFGLQLLVLLAVARVARLGPGFLLRRLRVEVPFLAFALFLPIVGESPRTTVLGVPLSEPGLWAAWNIAAKASLGVLASLLLVATTPVAELLRGLERLHLPKVLTAIAGFMVRYLDVIAGESRRMQIARLSRGDDPRLLWQARGLASTAGTLFVRSYERGERVHLAMCARGYAGAMPALHARATTAKDWLAGAAAPMAAAAVAVVALVAA